MYADYSKTDECAQRSGNTTGNSLYLKILEKAMGADQDESPSGAQLALERQETYENN